MQIAVKHKRWVVISAAVLILLATLSCQILNTPSLGFVPNAMPGARVGVFYYVIIKIANNRTPAGEFSISQGSLPRGLILQKITDQDARFNFRDTARTWSIPLRAQRMVLWHQLFRANWNKRLHYSSKSVMISAQYVPSNSSFCYLGEVESNRKWAKLFLLKQTSEELTSDVFILIRIQDPILISL